jgi:1-acyl-sn-glycerol-3-phosphate acyltransferase
MAEEKFIDIEKVIKSKNEKLYKWLPSFLVNYIKRIVHEDDINTILKENKNLFNEDFCNEIVDRFNLKIVVNGIENIPVKGPVIMAANHSLGGMDAMAIVSGLSKRRTDIRFIVNDILLNMNNLKGLFIGVNKHGKSSKESFNSINELFASDKAIFIFPAGLVSRKRKGKINDLEWKRTFVLKSKEHQTPIIPIHIDGSLSNFFYNLSNIREKLGVKANIEMLYLANEQFKLKGSTITINVGEPIHPKNFDSSKSNFEIAQWLKEQVYLLKD